MYWLISDSQSDKTLLLNPDIYFQTHKWRRIDVFFLRSSHQFYFQCFGSFQIANRHDFLHLCRSGVCSFPGFAVYSPVWRRGLNTDERKLSLNAVKTVQTHQMTHRAVPDLTPDGFEEGYPWKDTGSQAEKVELWFLWWLTRHRKCVVCASVLYLHWEPTCEITLICSFADWTLSAILQLS